MQRSQLVEPPSIEQVRSGWGLEWSTREVINILHSIGLFRGKTKGKNLVAGVGFEGDGGSGMVDNQLSQKAGKDSSSLAHVSAVFLSKLFKHLLLFTSYPQYIERKENN